MIKYWPQVDPHKEMCNLTEIESVFNSLRTIEPLIEIRYYLVKRVSQSISSLHHGVAERALLLTHNPVMLCLVREYKQDLMQLLVDSLLSNVHRNELAYLKLLNSTGIMTQKTQTDPKADLYGAHWS